MPHAASVIKNIAAFVESKNTPGSGERFVKKLKAAIDKLAIPKVDYSKCNYPDFAEKGYACSHFNDWVIAFKINGDKLTVYEIVHGALLA